MAITKIFNLETKTADPVFTQGHKLTPQSQALSIHWPNGGFVWNRPTAVLVEEDGTDVSHPITDVTRVAQVALFAFAILFTTVAGLLSLQRR